MTDIKEISIHARAGRDLGKTFIIQEVDPLTMSGFVLRLVSALRVENFSELLNQIGDAADGASINAIMNILRGADPAAVHALITEIVNNFVTIAPDPKHPSAIRRLTTSDIQEMATLGEVLMTFAKLHFTS